MNKRSNDKRAVRIKYLLNTHNGRNRYLPMVNVILSHKNNLITTTALIDSGATSTFIPLCLAQILEIDLTEKNDNVTGAGGNFPVYVTKLEKLKVIKGQTTLTEFENIIVRVPEDEKGVPFVILGRDYIFRKFVIKFEETKSQLQLLRIRR